jgi:hypothetical protein
VCQLPKQAPDLSRLSEDRENIIRGSVKGAWRLVINSRIFVVSIKTIDGGKNIFPDIHPPIYKRR